MTAWQNSDPNKMGFVLVEEQMISVNTNFLEKRISFFEN